MTKRKESVFNKWFIAQHGQRPSGLPINELQAVYMRTNDALLEAEVLLLKTQDYDNRKESAFYAWNAKP